MQWGGASWSSLTEHTAALDVGARLNVHRAADVAYESASGDSLLVYSNGGTTPQYKTKADGASSWSAPAPIPSWTGGGTPVFIRLEPSPDKNSNGVILAVQDTAGTSSNLHAAYWNGSSWSQQASFAVGISTSGTGNIFSQVFDVAWTSGGVKAIVAWGVLPGTLAGQQTPFYRIWYSTNTAWAVGTSTAPDLDGGATSEIPRWIRLASDPNSQNIAMGVADGDLDLTAMIWDGNTQVWGNQLTNAETAISQVANGYRPFDLAYERGGGQLLLAYTDGNAYLRCRTWTSGGGWLTEAACLTDTVGTTPIRNIEIISNPNDPVSDEMLIAVTNSGRQIRTYRWNGGSFDAAYTPTLFSQWTWETYPNAGMPFAMAYTRDFTQPTAAITAPVNNQHYAALTTITGTADDGLGNNVSGPARAEVEIQDLSNGQYYNATTPGWQAGQVWNTATGASPWQITGLGAIWTTTRQYQVRVRAVDNVGNIQGSPTVSQFVYDTALPTGLIVHPKTQAGLDGYYRGFQLATLTGTAGDAAPGEVSSLAFKLRREFPAATFNWWNRGTEAWQAGEIAYSTVTCGLNCWNATTGVWKSTYPAAAWNDGATYYFSLQVQDKAGNWRVTGTTNTFVVDETTPTVTWTLPGVNEGVYRGFTQIAGFSADDFPCA